MLKHSREKREGDVLRLLAIDTTSVLCGVAVVEGDTILCEETLHIGRGHAEALIPLMERVVAGAGLFFQDLERVAVTVGPGSFTGLRVGVAAAKGIAMACQIPVVGVSALAALAAPHMQGPKPLDPLKIVAGMDAMHQRGYVQGFKNSGEIWFKPCCMEINACVSSWSSPKEETEPQTVGLCGPLATALSMEAARQGKKTVILDTRLGPDINWVAQLGRRAIPDSAPPKPLYLREAQAAPFTGALQTAQPV